MGNTMENTEEIVVETTENEVERPYTMRKLRDYDLFPLLQLLRKLGIKDFKEVILNNKDKITINPEEFTGKNQEEIAEAVGNILESAGVDIVLDVAEVVISKLDTHSDSIYEFFSRLAGVPADEIKEMEFGTLPLMIYDAFCSVKNTAFFKVLFKLL